MRIEIISIGSELLTPQANESNSLFIIKELNKLGFRVNTKSIVEDKAATLEKILTDSISRANIMFATGGLGPTVDDVTVRAVSKVLGRKMVLNETWLSNIEEKFARRGMEMPLNNRKQALIPLGAKILKNKLGTAPGLWLNEGSCQIFLLPGVPSEMRQIFQDYVQPILRKLSRGKICRTKIYKIANLTESEVDWRIRELSKKYKEKVILLAYPGQIEVVFQAEAPSPQRADREVVQFGRLLKRQLGDSIFGTNGDSLEGVVGRLLKKKKATLAIAESCTGGLIASRITDIAGSSEFLERGVVAYSNRAKKELLGVKSDLIERFGAVSSEVAQSMAVGVKERSAVDYGLAVTGIAGPSGGSKEKPVGLVFLALASSRGVVVKKNLFSGDRERIKFYSSQAALDLLRRELLKS